MCCHISWRQQCSLIHTWRSVVLASPMGQCWRWREGPQKVCQHLMLICSVSALCSCWASPSVPAALHPHPPLPSNEQPLECGSGDWTNVELCTISSWSVVLQLVGAVCSKAATRLLYRACQHRTQRRAAGLPAAETLQQGPSGGIPLMGSTEPRSQLAVQAAGALAQAGAAAPWWQFVGTQVCLACELVRRPRDVCRAMCAAPTV